VRADLRSRRNRTACTAKPYAPTFTAEELQSAVEAERDRVVGICSEWRGLTPYAVGEIVCRDMLRRIFRPEVHAEELARYA
jgi:hypothetical protein